MASGPVKARRARTAGSEDDSAEKTSVQLSPR
jgi:hypothetical protein